MKKIIILLAGAFLAVGFSGILIAQTPTSCPSGQYQGADGGCEACPDADETGPIPPACE